MNIRNAFVLSLTIFAMCACNRGAKEVPVSDVDARKIASQIHEQAINKDDVYYSESFSSVQFNTFTLNPYLHNKDYMKIVFSSRQNSVYQGVNTFQSADEEILYSYKEGYVKQKTKYVYQGRTGVGEYYFFKKGNECWFAGSREGDKGKDLLIEDLSSVETNFLLLSAHHYGASYFIRPFYNVLPIMPLTIAKEVDIPLKAQERPEYHKITRGFYSSGDGSLTASYKYDVNDGEYLDCPLTKYYVLAPGYNLWTDLFISISWENYFPTAFTLRGTNVYINSSGENTDSIDYEIDIKITYNKFEITYPNLDDYPQM